MPLPRVSEGSDAALMRDAESPEFIQEILARLDEDNPVIANMIRGICEEYTEDDEPVMPLNKAVGMAVLVYRQLESQTEADDMNKEMKVLDDRHRQNTKGPS